MNAIFVKSLAEKTRRGQIGRVREGLAGSGRAYGYLVAPILKPDGKIERGGREINKEEAKIVRRIFKEYAAGKSARRIALELNEAGVPGPSGGAWKASVINGNVNRGRGILLNEIYAGRIVYNRTRTVRDPVTNRRLVRVNKESRWVVTDVPDLRIVNPALFEKVNRLRLEGYDRRRGGGNNVPRPLTDVLVCGVCGGKLEIKTARRYYCRTHMQGKGCANNFSVKEDDLKEAALTFLEKYIETRFDVLEKTFTALRARRKKTDGEIINHQDDISRRRRRLNSAVGAGMDSGVLRRRLLALKRDHARLGDRKEHLEKPPAGSVDNIKYILFKKLDATKSRLSKASKDTTYDKALLELRSLISEIKIKPSRSKKKTYFLKIKPSVEGLHDFLSKKKN